ncbi:MAG TPA: flavin reductase family protein [Phycisphaerae bacterium]|nr:flavin reductase family protein [Phycisphaerae bacterium]
MAGSVEQSVDRIAKALGRIPSGVAIVTTRAGNRRTGLLASLIQQASLDPPMISVAVKKGRPIEKLLDEAGTFVVNLLGERHRDAMFKHFAAGFSLDQDAFVGMGAKDLPGGVVIDDRIAYLSATIHGKYDAGDHWLYVGKVTGADIAEIQQPCVHLRKNGLSY